MTTSRREAIKRALAAGTALAPVAGTAATRAPAWGAGFDGQRKADLGQGDYLNPVLAGDHPDPTILKDGDDYWMTFSSFEALPALTIWHSRDLVNWVPVASALQRALGSVFAVDLCRHAGRYYLYVPVIPTAVSTGLDGQPGIYVIHAEHPTGPWSEPVSLGIAGYIDPGHVVGEDGRRYLFLSGISRVRLRADGLATDGPIEPAYDGWHYPDDWVTEAYALEGPKLLRRGDWFYLVSAVGGTAGPPTSHMVIVARSRSVHGPWQNCPHNPIVRTRSASERWWSRGHASLVQGPQGDWWLVYHGYENGYRTLGRQMLLEPVAWKADGWPRALGGDLSRPLRKPRGGQPGPHGAPLSDDFSVPRFGRQWSFYDPGAREPQRARLDAGALVIQGKGRSPADCSPLTCVVGDHAYEISVELELSGAAHGGLLLFYGRRLFCGMGHDGQRMSTWRSGLEQGFWREPAGIGTRWQLRIVNDHHIVTMHYRRDAGQPWTRHGLRMDTSGHDTNAADELLSLRPALFAAGDGEVRFRDFRYRALP